MFFCCCIFAIWPNIDFFISNAYKKSSWWWYYQNDKFLPPQRYEYFMYIIIVLQTYSWGKFLSQHRCSFACCCLQREKADLGTLMFVYNNIKVCSVDSVLHFLFTVEKGTPQYFDAFICYSPQGEDLTFVKEMITKLENPPHNLKLFVPWRDDLPGGSRYVIDARLIEMR